MSQQTASTKQNDKSMAEPARKVSVIVPFRDEGGALVRCVRSLLDQDCDPGAYDIVLVKGGPDEPDPELRNLLAQAGPRVRLIDNPDKNTPAGLNRGLAEGDGDVLLIMSAHAEADRSFVRSNLEEMARTGADCVGGRLETVGRGYVGKAIAAILSSPFGVGNSRFRTSDYEGYVDTVAYGAYKREVFDKLGAFDERLIRNQDVEFNYRLRSAGGKIWMSPKIRSFYYCPNTLTAFMRQAFSNGLWNIKTWQITPGSLSWRHFVPLTFVLSLVTGLVLVPFGGLGLYWLGAILISYKALALAYAALAAGKTGWLIFPILPVLFLVLHTSYGLGSLRGLLEMTGSNQGFERRAA